MRIIKIYKKTYTNKNLFKNQKKKKNKKKHYCITKYAQFSFMQWSLQEEWSKK